MISHVFQFHAQMAQFPPALHGLVNNDDQLYELFRDELFDACATDTLLEYITGLDPEECPFCQKEPVYSYAHPAEQIGLYVADWEMSTPCQIHGGPAA